MAIVKFDPFRGFERMQRKMNEIVGELEKGVNFETGAFMPRVDITESENKIFVHAELPGITKENVKISVNEDRMLTIKGEKSVDDSVREKNFIRTERVFGSFLRTFLLPENIDINSVEAKYDNGVLELSISKIEPQKPKEIEIEIK